MKEIIIEFKNISKRYQNGKWAIRNFSLQVQKGQSIAIVGKSGAGKSTLMRLLTALDTPTEGHIFIHGDELDTMPPKKLRDIRKKMGMVFQHFNLFNSKTVSENIAYAMEVHGVPSEQREKRVSELLQLVHLEGKEDSYPLQLSGGEKQRVGIARALANDPEILICDEASSALDENTAHSILQLLHNLNQKLGVTILFITHHLEAARFLCPDVTQLEAAS